MLRLITIFFLFITSLFASADLVKIYLNDGLEAVGVAIEKELANKNLWLEQLANKDISLGYYDNDAFIVRTNKTDKVVRVYSYKNGVLQQQFEQKDVITGLMGDKEKEGDLKTPVGFYELGRKFRPDQYYGPLAFATSYPNLLDQLQGKTGGGIWIHGYPLDGERLDEFKTRGCIALTNDQLENFSKVLDDGKTKVFVLTEEKDYVSASKDEIAGLFADLFAWKHAWTISDVDTYLSFYDKDNFRRFDKSQFSQFAEMKRSIFSRKEHKVIKFSNISISPYPNINGDKMYRISFFEDYYTKNYQFRGDKVLYVRLGNNGKMQILAEK
ncbi:MULTISPECIES: murein L,D-transpeptidase family protein [unclassified Campylobacter]|uniref:L,D-transpeptidase family protein n=1 Tax=unclassified Campylobacter TaxID=2593542 RepID=UPI001237CBC5|nr:MULTISPECIES: murein L,D-transpeptidase family protein [unclassified Campylobacter]KAA6224734.1 murein L,D-transpeptidase [Campylobacter sp. LR185c]KAA6225731.1 murein L,D-transpeptidase [Campylobacter sp. LR286c]KAA6225852.1 murein L,D-transpeptidase [Campylobacter sp. LR196d]KAA6229704.1 murein L,D-transpeptidase [Campylobacter sp. LR291e]KAA6230050.1 murein L,D-transpeptidase [Campylobacter sp. LR264d]